MTMGESHTVGSLNLSDILKEIEGKVSVELNKIKAKINNCRTFGNDNKKEVLNNCEEILKLFNRQKELIKDKVNEKVINKPSYAEIVKKPLNQNPIQNKHVIYVQSKDNDITVPQLKEKIKSKIDPKRCKIGIKNMRFVKRGLIIECNDNNECEKLKNEINNNLKDCDAKIPEKRLPRMVIYGISKDMNAEEIINSIIEQNKQIKDEIKDENDLKFKFFMKTKSDNYQNAIIEVKPYIRKIMLLKYKLFVGFNCCKTNDFVRILQCFNCYGYGHLTRECTNEKVCSNCSESHDYRECHSNHYKCLNCNKYNSKVKDPKHKVDINHSSMDHVKCSTYHYIKKTIVERTNYE